jgi:hypothetical protein
MGALSARLWPGNNLNVRLARGARFTANGSNSEAKCLT